MSGSTAVAAALSLAVAGCGGAKSDAGPTTRPRRAKGTVKLAINPWVGYEANAAVIGYLLEKKLGYKVEKKNLKEEISWQGFETGEVDAIVENWGHDDLKKTYITRQEGRGRGRPDRQQGRDRLVRAAVDGRQVPGHHRLART